MSTDNLVIRAMMANLINQAQGPQPQPSGLLIAFRGRPDAVIVVDSLTGVEDVPTDVQPEYVVFSAVGDYGLAYLRSTTPAMNEMWIEDPQDRPPARFKNYAQAKAAAEICCGYVMAVDPD